MMKDQMFGHWDVSFWSWQHVALWMYVAITLVEFLRKHLLPHFVYVHMQQAEMSTILFQLKGSPQIIEDVLENVSKVTG